MLFRDRDKSKSAGDDSAASIRKKFLSYFARFTCSLDILEILYAKLSTSIGSFLRSWNLKSYIAWHRKRIFTKNKRNLSNKLQYITVQTYVKKKSISVNVVMKHSRSLNFTNMFHIIFELSCWIYGPFTTYIEICMAFLIIEFSSRIYDVFFSARFLTASFAPKTRRKNSVRWNMLLSFINAEMSHDSLAGEKARRSLMTDVHGTTQRKSSPLQIVQIYSTVMPIVKKRYIDLE